MKNLLSFKQIEVDNLTQGEMKEFWEALPILLMCLVLIGLMLFGISSCNQTLGVQG